MTKQQWDAIRNRDSAYDGVFFYGNRMTKNFCRPSCRKRGCDVRLVVIFDTAAQAVEQGYRPCSRCHPETPGWTDAKTELSRSAESFLRAHYAERFSLDAVAEAMHVDKSYLARCFKSVTGRTLLDYCHAVRCEEAKELLIRPELAVSHIASAVGYVSASHFTQIFRKYAGSTPTEFRAAYFKSLEET